jgi:hypothetical protein
MVIRNVLNAKLLIFFFGHLKIFFQPGMKPIALSVDIFFFIPKKTKKQR